MVKHGALSKSHVYQLLRSKDARVRRAAFTLLETSNPRFRTNSGNLEQYSLSAISALAERAVAALVPR